MLMAGTNIQGAADPLHKVQDDYLYNSICHPKPLIEDRIRQLRIVYSLDARKYADQKRMLPYVVCGIFNPQFRNKENFAYIDRFILDIDKLSQKQLSLSEVRKKVEADDRVLMCFASPSEDGLKVMFRLADRCCDSGLYSIFYRKFAQDFSKAYGLEQVIDKVTSDVSRACFISMDAHAYYNPDAQPINLKDFADVDNPMELQDMRHSVEKAMKEAADKKKEATPKLVDPDREVMARIKAQLNPKAQPMPQKPPVVVPEILDDIMGDLAKYIQETGIVVAEVVNIQYGKKIKCKLGLKMSEVNLFYGHRGFSVVLSPRCGTDVELNNVTRDLVSSFIDTYQG